MKSILKTMLLHGFLLLTLAVVLLVLAFILYWYYIFFSYKKYLKAFPVLSQLPILGVAHYVRNTIDIHDQLLLHSRILGRNGFGMLGLIPVLFTSDPELFSIVLGSPKLIDKPPLFYNMLENAASNSLLVVSGNKWRQQRKMSNPGLDYANVKGNIHIFNAKSDDLVKALADEAEKESTKLDSFIETWALSQAYETILGDTAPLKDRLSFLEAVKCSMKIAIKRMMRINEFFKATYVFTRNYWLERKMLKIFFDHTRDVIRRRKAEKESGEIRRDRPIMIDILLKQMETDENVTETFIAKQLNMMIMAGFDTSASAICFALYNLSINSGVQEKAYDELFSLLGDDINQPITLQHINDMKYLDLVIKESLRTKTPVPFFGRKLNEDVEYKGTTLPKGLTILLLAYVMHIDPELYPDPEKFIPERFLPENLNPNRYSYAPFAGGVRNCIGQKYANLSLKVVLAKILLNYELVDAHHELRLACEMTLRSKTGVRVGLRRRTFPPNETR